MSPSTATTAQRQRCTRCGKGAVAFERRVCMSCRSQEEAVRRRERRKQGDNRPCAVEGCWGVRHIMKSQISSYCTQHHLETRRRIRIKAQYGVTLEEFDAIVAEAGGPCALCSRKQKLVMDHCHRTKARRGMLCRDCNLGLGNFDDDIERLQAAIRYLQAAR